METRKELVESPEYITTVLQIQIYNMVRNYLKESGLTQTEFAKRLGVSKGYVSQILNCRCDNRLSSLVKLALACGKLPDIEFRPVEQAEVVTEKKQFNVGKRRNIRILYKRMFSEKLKPIDGNPYRAEFRVGEMNDEQYYNAAV